MTRTRKRRPSGLYLDATAAADHLGVSLATLYRWRRKGVVPYVKVVGSIRFRRTDLDQMMEDHIVRVADDGEMQTV